MSEIFYNILQFYLDNHFITLILKIILIYIVYVLDKFYLYNKLAFRFVSIFIHTGPLKLQVFCSLYF